MMKPSLHGPGKRQLKRDGECMGRSMQTEGSGIASWRAMEDKGVSDERQ